MSFQVATLYGAKRAVFASATDVAVLALVQAAVPPDELPHAAMSKNATTAKPSWRVGLINFMLPSPFDTAPPHRRPICRGNIAPDPPALQGRSGMRQLISASRRLTLARYRGTPSGGKGPMPRRG